MKKGRGLEAADLLARWRADRMLFRKAAILLEDGRPFGEVMEPWQEEDFRGLDTHRHGYFERPRGHSKTGDTGTEAVTELVLGRPGAQLFCAAADEEQAGLLLKDVRQKFERSPILRPLVRFTRAEVVVRSTGSVLRVMSSDAPSAYGLRPDWIAVDELAEWKKRDLWDSLWSATGKRPGCRMLVISTAGWDRTSIAWEVRHIAEREGNWYFSSRGQCASWVEAAWLAQQERTLPAHTYARLHRNVWVEGVGAFLTTAEVDRVFADAVPDGSGPIAIGLDLGLSRDRTAIALVRADADVGALVEALVTHAPVRGGRVDLRDVEDEVGGLARNLGAPVVLDPWQGVLMAERLRASGVEVIEHPFTTASRQKLFGALLDLVRTSRLRSRPHDELRRELLSLEVHETAAGWRVDHRVGRHDDHVVAVALGVAGLMAMPGQVDAGPTAEEVQALRGLARGLGVPVIGLGDDDTNFITAMDERLEGDERVRAFLDGF